MPRRRRKRRQRIERQEQREEAVAAGIPVSEEAEPAPSSERATGGSISFSGAAGGIIATGTLGASAILFLIDDDGLRALVVALIAPFFVPATIVSLISGNVRRQYVLRISTAGCLGITALLTLFVDFGFLVLMMMPTALLAFGAGFIFQRSGSSR